MLSDTNHNKFNMVLSEFYNNKLMGFYFEDDKLQRISHMDSESVVGNIYCGYVKDVVKNIGAAFLEFGDGFKGYYSLTDNKPLFLSYKNNDNVNQGDVILVQVVSDKIKTKDYTLSSKITFTGKYIVLTVANTSISISKKIDDEKTRNFFRKLLKPFKNDEYGFIVRTSCTEATEEEILDEINSLISKWNEIKGKAVYLKAKSLVFSENTPLITECTEYGNKFSGTVITENKEIHKELDNAGIDVKLYESDLPIHKCYSLEKHLQNALSKKVWLKSGAYLVIEQTEALTSIDVNTGKAEFSSKNKENTFFKINNEAALEIARQLKIRNISGMILIDFISMDVKENEDALTNKMKELLKYDYSKATVISITKLGLMEITRKKGAKSIYEICEEDAADKSTQIALKNAEIKALQNQINAHFMYNALESIKMMAEIQGSFEISDAMTSLGQMFRYSMKWSASGMVNLKDELEYIKKYLDLLNLRCDYEIYLSLNIPKEFLDVQIPKMSLQPLVENSIYHGIEDMAEDTSICIEAFEENGILNIEVYDEGKGISKDNLLKINEKLQSKHIDESKEHGRALFNVQERIRMYFGEEFGIKIFSKENLFTKVLVQIPIERNIDR